jgi:hypothetical protein
MDIIGLKRNCRQKDVKTYKVTTVNVELGTVVLNNERQSILEEIKKKIIQTGTIIVANRAYVVETNDLAVSTS